MAAHPTRPARRIWRLAAILLVMALATPAAPALAIHQHCGDDYPQGTQASGHPDVSEALHGWAGTHHVQALETSVEALGAARTALDGTASQLVAIAEVITAARLVAAKPAIPGAAGSEPARPAEDALRIAATVLHSAEIVVFVGETAVQAALFAVSAGVDDEDACGGTLTADTVSLLWIAIVERNLASSGPPLAILMTPQDGLGPDEEWPLMPRTEADDFAWCPPLTTGEELPSAANPAPAGAPSTATTGGDCSSQVHLGFLDADTLGVKDIVTNTIDHAAAHGLDIRLARDHLGLADAHLDAGRYRDAYEEYRLAYRNAMGLTQ